LSRKEGAYAKRIKRLSGPGERSGIATFRYGAVDLAGLAGRALRRDRRKSVIGAVAPLDCVERLSGEV